MFVCCGGSLKNNYIMMGALWCEYECLCVHMVDGVACGFGVTAVHITMHLAPLLIIVLD